MTEINKNLIGSNIPTQMNPKSTPVEETSKNVESEPTKKETSDIKDTGVLGRSLVDSNNGANITKSVNEAVNLAQKAPEVMYGCESLFGSLYQQYVDQGMESSDAYMKALFAEEELLGITRNKY